MWLRTVVFSGILRNKLPFIRVGKKKLNTGLLTKRREKVFGIAVLTAGLTVAVVCLMPIVITDTSPLLLLPTAQQERFFFDIFGIICACWLLSFVSAVNEWETTAKAGQWLGILMLCAEQSILLGVWRDAFVLRDASLGAWVAPLAVELYLLGFLFSFFTQPSLTRSGNTRLTGLGALLLLMPWLFGRDSFIAGTEILHGLIF